METKINGSAVQPLAFKPAIPIIGQPFQIKGWFSTVLIVCNCPAKESIVIPQAAAARCPSCGRVFLNQGPIIQNNSIIHAIGMAVPEDEGVARV